MGKYAIGVDFGTGSGRVAVVNVKTGEIKGRHELKYKHGVIDKELPYSKITLKKDTVVQHPQDYLDVLETSIPMGLKESGIDNSEIVGIGLDFTACTVIPVDKSLNPMCFKSEWKRNPHSWVKLWKHHAAQKQANRINELAIEREEPWLKQYGGIISSEWMLPKVMEILEDDPALYEETDYFLEAVDWLTSLMTGTLKRSSCAAGFKGLWNKKLGYVDNSFLKALHPELEHVYESKLHGEVCSVGKRAGILTADFANRIGLKEGTPVALGLIDAHAGALGSGVITSDTMAMVMGTSTCHILLSEQEKFVSGISGVVEDGIIPNFYAYEGGQAAVGDIFELFMNENVPTYIRDAADREKMSLYDYMEFLATNLGPGSNGLLALDWHNGCRTPFVDSDLSGVIVGLTLSTKPEEIYRALLESTAYGTKLIIELFEKEGIKIKELVACGGLPLKNKLLMQIYADVTGRPIKVTSNTITPAIGSAIYGAVAAGSKNGGYDDIAEATNAMKSLSEIDYIPKQENKEKYLILYQEYVKLVNYFGKGGLMKQLRSLC